MSTKTSKHKKNFWSKVLAVTLSGLLAIQMCPASALAVPGNTSGETPAAAGEATGSQAGDAPAAGAGAAGTAGTDVSATQGSAADALTKADSVAGNTQGDAADTEVKDVPAKTDPASGAAQDNKDQAASDKPDSKDEKDQAKKNVAPKENLQFRTPRADGQVTDDSIVSGVIAANGRGYSLLSSSGNTQISAFSTEPFYGGTTQDIDGKVYRFPPAATQDGYTVLSAPINDAYVWNAKSDAKDHRFNFRISFKLGNKNGQGVFVGSPDDAISVSSGSVVNSSAVRIKIPTSIIKDQTGARGDYFEMSIPSREDVLEAIANDEQLDRDMSFAWYEEVEVNPTTGQPVVDATGQPKKTGNIILYNFRDIQPGFDGFIELSYITKYATFDYKDMTESSAFAARIDAVLTNPDTGAVMATDSKTHTSGPVYINTQVMLQSDEVRIPVKYDNWPFGTAPTKDAVGFQVDSIKVKDGVPVLDEDGNYIVSKVDFDSGDYTYMVWEIRDRVADNSQEYLYAIQNEIVSLLAKKGGQEVAIPEGVTFPIAVKFSGDSTYTMMDHDGTLTTGAAQQKNFQSTDEMRYENVVIAFRKDFWSYVDHWEITTDTTMEVSPRDGIDPSSKATYRRSFSYNVPTFEGVGGGFGGWKWADGMYRYQAIRETWPRVQLSELGMRAGQYSRYDLDDLLKENDPKPYLGDLDYAVGMQGYILPWTLQAGAEKDNIEAYNVEPVRYVLTDDRFYMFDEDDGLATDPDTGEPSEEFRMKEGDFRLDSVAFSLSVSEKEYNDSTAAFDKSTDVAYLQDNAKANKGSLPDWASERETFRIFGKTSNGNWEFLADWDVASKKLVRVSDQGYITNQPNVVTNKIVFAEGESIPSFVGYRIETYNTHYYSLIGSVPNIRIMNGEMMHKVVKVQSTQTGANGEDSQAATDSVGIYNKSDMRLFDYKSAYDAAKPEVQEASDSGEQPLSKTAYTNQVHGADPADADYVRRVLKQSNLKKDVVSTANNVKKKQCSITWHAAMSETFTAGEDEVQEYIEQQGGTFYDLLPVGASLDLGSVMVRDESGTLSPAVYDVEQFQNFNDTGRVLVKVTITSPAKHYDLYFNSIHPYESLRVYGNMVYNPIAYETGNEEISGGQINDSSLKKLSGTVDAQGNPKYMSAVRSAEISNLPDGLAADANRSSKFIYNEREYDVAIITAAATGISKKVLTTQTKTYDIDGMTPNNDTYNYRVHFQNSYANTTVNTKIYDVLEAYSPEDKGASGRSSDWHGTFDSVDVSQIVGNNELSVLQEGMDVKDAPTVEPKVYVSTKPRESFDLEGDSKLTNPVQLDLSNTEIWTPIPVDDNGKARIPDGAGFEAKDVMAVALDLSTDTAGHPFEFKKGAEISAYIYMQSPGGAERKDGTDGYPEAYNDIYIYRSLKTESTDDPKPELQHRPYTTVGLKVFGSLNVHKISEERQDIEGISFSLTGKSAYGTDVNMVATSDRNGYLTFQGVEMGSYTLEEYECSSDWLEYGKKHTVTINSNGVTSIDGTEYASKAFFEVVNQPRLHGDVRFLKARQTTATNKSIIPIKGVSFQLYGESAYGNAVSAFAESNEFGMVSLYNIEIGNTYKLREVETTDEYLKSSEEYNVSVMGTNPYDIQVKITKPDGTPVYQTSDEMDVIFNTPKYWDFDLRKIDAENSSRWLQGATLRLSGETLEGYSYKVSETETLTATKAANGAYYIDVVSDANGKASFPHLKAGAYVLTEVAAPSGVDVNGHTGNGGTLNYIRDAVEHTVVINPDGSIETDNGIGRNEAGEPTLANGRALDGEIIVYKKWEDNLTGQAAKDRPEPQITLESTSESTTIHGVTVTKEWVGDTDTTRPTPDKVEFKLYKQPNQFKSGDETFTVVDFIESPEPSDLASTASDCALLDTGIRPSANTRVDMVYETTGYRTDQRRTPLGVIDSDQKSFLLYDGYDGNRNRMEDIRGPLDKLKGTQNALRDQSSQIYTVQDNTRYRVQVNKGGTILQTVNPETGRVIDTVASSVYESQIQGTTQLSLYLFGNHNGSGNDLATAMRVYSCRIYEGDTLVRDFLPVHSSTRGYGLYDLINNEFHGNANTKGEAAGKKFTGPDVSSVEPELVSTSSKDSKDWQANGNVWTYTFDDVVVDGKSTYYVQESIVPTGYESSAGTHDSKVTVQSGKAHITNTLKKLTYNFTYRNEDGTTNRSAQEFEAPMSGTYKVELWGAQGGGTAGGKGAYTSGVINLKAGDKFYVYVGQDGTQEVSHLAGDPYEMYSFMYPSASANQKFYYASEVVFNNGTKSSYDAWSNGGMCYAGGGATDIRIASGDWNNFDSLKSRIMVAGAGGGQEMYWRNCAGSPGGGLTGIGAKNTSNGSSDGFSTTDPGGGEQTQGGLNGWGVHWKNAGDQRRGGFGYAIQALGTLASGGSGYYAGGGGAHHHSIVGPGAGGSSFISGHPGCDAINATSTANNISHSGKPNHYSGKVFTATEMKAGNEEFDSPAGVKETGHSGDGYARITYIPASTQDADSDEDDDDPPAPSTQALPAKVYKSEDGKWDKISDDTWKYTFHVFDDTVDFKVIEADIDGYQAVGSQQQTIEGSVSKSVVFVNRSEAAFGSLKLQKQVQDTTTDQGFKLTVQLTGASIPTSGTKNIGGMMFKAFADADGQGLGMEASFTLADGETALIENVPVGTHFKVLEAANENFTPEWTTEWATDEGQHSAATNEGTIVKNVKSIVTCTNNYTPPEVVRSDIKVKKLVAGAVDSSDEAMDLQADYTFFASLTGLDKENTYSIVDASGNDLGHFTSDAAGNGTAKIVIKHGQTAIIEQVPVGTKFTVSEEAGDYKPSFVVSDENGGTSIANTSGGAGKNQSLITAQETVDPASAAQGKPELPVVTFTNTIEGVQNLTIKKATVIPDSLQDLMPTESFNVTVVISGLNPGVTIFSDAGAFDMDDGTATKEFSLRDGTSVEVWDIPVGATYTVTEAKSRYKASYVIKEKDQEGNQLQRAAASNDGPEAPITAENVIRRGKDSSVELTNTAIAGTLTVAKFLSGNMADRSKRFQFDLTVKELRGKTVAATDGTMYSFDSSGKTRLALGSEENVTFVVPIGSEYSVSEREEAGCSTTYQIDQRWPVKGTSVRNESVTGDNVVKFVNTLDVPIPTGVAMSLAIPLALIAGAVTCLVLFMRRRRED